MSGWRTLGIVSLAAMAVALALGWAAGEPRAFFGQAAQVSSTTAKVRAVAQESTVQDPPAATFGEDLLFLRKYTDVLVLSDNSRQAQVAVCPSMQGRIMTSTAAGLGGTSFGWINRELIASGKVLQHINPYGGEDRFWLGPEGGQFSIFFKKGVPFDLEHWFTPAPIDTEPFDLVARGDEWALFRKKMHLVNYSGTEFDLLVEREVRLLGADIVRQTLGLAPPPTVRCVAFQSENKIRNIGSEPWRKETGLLSIWILGMFNPSPRTTVVIPFKPGPVDKLGPIVNDAYFGKVPADRLIVKRDVLFFRGDGQYRSKIGISPRRAKPFLGSYDATTNTLTVVWFNLPKGVTDYVNSMWEIQKEPYGGDAVNSYNDGPPAPGAKPLGPFYELETSSPAAALTPGSLITHIHRTMHFQGPEADLDRIARATLGVTIAQIKAAFN